MWLFYVVILLILVFGIVVFRGAPYVPTHHRQARRALSELYDLTEKDVFIDLGSGDGVLLRMAAARGARAIGYEINPILVLISNVMARGNPRISTRLDDMWRVQLPPDTTVVYVFAVTRDIDKVAKKVQLTANELGHRIWLIVYGARPSDKVPEREVGAHALFAFYPETNETATLHRIKA